MSDEKIKPDGEKSSLQNKLSSIFGHGQERLTSRVKEWDARKALDAVLDAPKSLQREWEKHGSTGILTKFPIFMVTMCLLATSFFVYHSGFLTVTKNTRKFILEGRFFAVWFDFFVRHSLPPTIRLL